MLIAFYVNSIDSEYPRYTTTVLAHEASRRGHDVCYVTPGDFVLSPKDTLQVHAHKIAVGKGKTRSRDEFFKALKSAGKKSTLIDITEIDVLMLRSDPSNDAVDRQCQGPNVLFQTRDQHLGGNFATGDVVEERTSSLLVALEIGERLIDLGLRNFLGIALNLARQVLGFFDEETLILAM